VSILVRQSISIATDSLREAEWNANRVSKPVLKKIRNSLMAFGAVENFVIRPDWCVGTRSEEELSRRRAVTPGDPEWYEVLSGNHRLRIYREEEVPEALAIVIELTDAKAKVLAQAINRTRGTNDDPTKRNALLLDVLRDLPMPDVSSLLPHSERDLSKLLGGRSEGGGLDPDELNDLGDTANSEVFTVYELGPHRIICGDAANPEIVSELLLDELPVLMVTDPPYGVGLDQTWRERVMARGGTHGSLAPFSSQADQIEGDDPGFEWVPALGLVDIPVAYVWHAAKFSSLTEALLLQAGYDVRQQIVWQKDHAPISQSAYHWKHETAWYAVKANQSAPWYGGRNQTTVWNAKAPRQLVGSQEVEERCDHPTQKPVVIFETPILNHLKSGEIVYDPFLGSGTALIAAAKTGRRCFGCEVEPKYVDVIRRRWGKWARENNVDPGPGAL
jgi:DNA modification methylase